MNTPAIPPRLMRGATVGADGASGYVPTPLAADRAKAFFGDGTWKALPGGGDMLAANSLGDVGSVPAAQANLGVYSKSEVAALRNALAPVQAMSFDGTGNPVTLANAKTIGSGNWSYCAAISPITLGSSGRVIASGTTFEIGVLSTGLPYVYNGTTLLSGTTAIAAAAFATIGYKKSGSTGTFFVNGVPAGTVTDNSTYGTITSLGGTNGTSGFYGAMRFIGLASRAPTDAEMLAIFRSGTYPDTDYSAGNMLLAPETNPPGAGLLWLDMSGSTSPAHLIFPLAHVAWTLRTPAQTRIRGTTSTSGNEKLLGASTINTQIEAWTLIRVRARARSGTPSVTLGTTSGGTNLVASVALSTNWKQLTIAASDPTFTTTGVGTATNLWVGSSTAAIIEWDISIEPVNY